MNLLFILAVLSFVATSYATGEIFFGIRKMKTLTNIKPVAGMDHPKVSIIVPACNEEDTIEPALLSLLHQDYEKLEIIVVNDRSTDGTGQVLKRLKQKFPQLLIHEITDLPTGWLGKCNALHQGAHLASGEYLLFTDADVIMEKTTLSRAVTGMINNQLDHLSLIFKSIVTGGLLNAMILDAGGGLLLLFKPWNVYSHQSKRFMGVGAFNMVRTSIYKQVGGHESIKMHPIDDIMLGKIIKQHGFRQDCFLGYDFVTVRWYKTPSEMINGLMKNVFALYDFKVIYVLVAIILTIIVNILPFWALFFTNAYAMILFILTILTRFFSFANGSKAVGISVWYFPWSLITPYINILIMAKATLSTLKNNGIDWRGTHYSLIELRKNSPIL